MSAPALAKYAVDTGCSRCPRLLAEMQSARMEAGVICQEEIIRVIGAEQQLAQAYERWDAAFHELQEHVQSHRARAHRRPVRASSLGVLPSK